MLIRCFSKVKEKHPLVQCFANIVTANGCANLLLAAGASPVMSEDVVGNFWTDEGGVDHADTIHLNRDGEYLQACVWTAKLFGADVTKLQSVPETLKTPANAALLRACARDAVAEGI